MLCLGRVERPKEGRCWRCRGVFERIKLLFGYKIQNCFTSGSSCVIQSKCYASQIAIFADASFGVLLYLKLNRSVSGILQNVPPSTIQMLHIC